MIVKQFNTLTADELKRDEPALVTALKAGGCIVKGRTVRCGFCDDHKPSAGIYSSNGILRYKCHKCGRSGTIIDVLSWVDGISVPEVFKSLKSDPNAKNSKPVPAPAEQKKSRKKMFKTLNAVKSWLQKKEKKQVTREHPYHNAKGHLVQYVLRLDNPNDPKDKTYRPVTPVEDGFEIGAPEKPRLLYNLMAVIAAEVVIIVEGEKTADALIKYDIPATTTSGGAGKAVHTDLEPLKRKTAIIWPDNDPKGIEHGEDLKKRLLECGRLR